MKKKKKETTSTRRIKTKERMKSESFLWGGVKNQKGIGHGKRKLDGFYWKELYNYYRKENEKLKFDPLITVIVSNGQL